MKANINWDNIPETMGIYMLKGQDGQVIYVSKARNLKEKMKDYSVDTNNAAQDLLLDNIFSFEIIETTDEKKTYQLEKKLIEEYNPKFNIKIKSATSYPYVEFCTKQEKPLLKLAKTRKKKSSIYFGPVKTNQFGHQVVFLLNKIIDSEYGNNATPDEFKTICDDFFSGENKIVNKLIDKYGNEDDVKIVKLWNESNTKMFDDKLKRDIFNYYYQDGILSICLTFVRFGNVGVTANFFQKSFESNPSKAVENFISRYYEEHIFPDEIITPFEYIPWVAPKSVLMTPYDEKTKALSENAMNVAKSKFDKRVTPYRKKFDDYSKLKKESE